MTEHTKAITTTALMTAVLCILGPLSIPIGPVPISLTPLAVFLARHYLARSAGRGTGASAAFARRLAVLRCKLSAFLCGGV